MAEYHSDLFKSMRQVEVRHRPRLQRILAQREITLPMRALLIDWLFDMCEEFSYRHTTLFLAAVLVDRYLSVVAVSRLQLQLVGATAVVIASKFEESQPPSFDALVYLTANEYRREDFVTTELRMLQALNFEVASPTSAHFLAQLLVMINSPMDSEPSRHAQHLLELALLDECALCFAPSTLAAAALLQSRRDCGASELWPEALRVSCEITEDELEPCAQALARLRAAGALRPLHAVRRSRAAARGTTETA
eukprot:TRINITY_DN32888_c0_g1_i1.p1 TRINITY_DN32888_c0_g1~~TRINITY_DN32888_c0_g1_i1.p1  ORF type:complete len:285 (+),score=72.77 TRINITY_DN32888_c0_g1_i1:104-856(+)